MTSRLWLIFGVVIFSACATGLFVSNLSDACLRCICQGTTGCNMTYGCAKGYCGPFYISRLYWIDADKPVLSQDDPERDGAYQDCSFNYNCAKLIVERYMAKYGRDCNGDHITTCEDYALIHFNGGSKCNTPITGTGYYSRFSECRQAASGII
ncbi:lysozyme 2-like [Ischnura elegans]|uniref:lysozyme 2-like n=1 Tax=Ischnura elegans TaxID=197161 RepID=UPI001ED8865E|nr:lysozyme 2-like [Ischnura elegans]